MIILRAQKIPPPPADLGDMEEAFTEAPPAQTEPADLGKPLPSEDKLSPKPADDIKVRPPNPQRPEDPAKLYEEIVPPETPLEQKNRMDKNDKIYLAITESLPLRITYTTLPKEDNPAGSTTVRTVQPDYVYTAGTGRSVMVAWCQSKNDWRAFVVDNIREADLVPSAPQEAIA